MQSIILWGLPKTLVRPIPDGPWCDILREVACTSRTQSIGGPHHLWLCSGARDTRDSEVTFTALAGSTMWLSTCMYVVTWNLPLVSYACVGVCVHYSFSLCVVLWTNIFYRLLLPIPSRSNLSRAECTNLCFFFSVLSFYLLRTSRVRKLSCGTHFCIAANTLRGAALIRIISFNSSFWFFLALRVLGSMVSGEAVT